MNIRFVGIDDFTVQGFRAGGPDAYGLPPERAISPGGMPCRHCMGKIDAGEEMLILAYRPFPNLQPYAETGPIFLHAEDCGGSSGSNELPAMLDSTDYIVRGYSSNHRIVYGTGAVIPTASIKLQASELLKRSDVGYVHVRSARNNCYQCSVITTD